MFGASVGKLCIWVLLLQGVAIILLQTWPNSKTAQQ